MNNILSLIKQNRIDYHKIIDNSVVRLEHVGVSKIKTIIGVRGRRDHLIYTVNSLLSSGGASILVVEMDSDLKHESLCESLKVGYIGIKNKKGEQYSRSLASNIGVMLCGDCDWVVTHDVDCFVQNNFYKNILLNIMKKGASAIQPFNKRRVLYCDDRLTRDVFRGYVNTELLNEKSVGVFTCPGEAPGGSVFLSRELFFEIGGYDPELFFGYAPEDQMFWEKMSVFTHVYSADDPIVDVFHLHHESLASKNPRLGSMIKTMNEFRSLSRMEKMYIINHKREIIQEWA